VRDTDEAMQFLMMINGDDDGPSPFMDGSPVLCSTILVLPAEEEIVEKESQSINWGWFLFGAVLIMIAVKGFFMYRKRVSTTTASKTEEK
jgi:hypothetical protein